MTTEELEIITGKLGMQRLELKESFGAGCLGTACVSANAGAIHDQ